MPLEGRVARTSGPDRETIYHALKQHLLSRAEILFAYVHGSLVDGVKSYRDVDVALFLDPAWVGAHKEDLLAYVLDRSTELTVALREEIGLRVPVDVQVLNDAPLLFQMHVIRDGRLLFTRDEEALVDFIERTARQHMDMEPLLREYMRELLS